MLRIFQSLAYLVSAVVLLTEIHKNLCDLHLYLRSKRCIARLLENLQRFQSGIQRKAILAFFAEMETVLKPSGSQCIRITPRTSAILKRSSPEMRRAQKE